MDLLDYSYFGIIVFLFLTGCGLPLPEEVGIFTAATLAAKGRPEQIPLYLASCIVGCLLGDSIMYAIGRYFGRGLLKRNSLWNRLITPEREQMFEDQIKQHGIKAFFLARFLVGVRGPIYLTAGILKVSFYRFLLVDTAAASLVISIFFTLSYFFGGWLVDWIRAGEKRLTYVAVPVGLAVVAYLWYRHHKKKTEQARLAQLCPPAAEDGSSTHSSSGSALPGDSAAGDSMPRSAAESEATPADSNHAPAAGESVRAHKADP